MSFNNPSVFQPPAVYKYSAKVGNKKKNFTTLLKVSLIREKSNFL